MPRSGNVYSPPAGTKGTPNTTIESSKYNAFVDDLTTDANAARPVTAGGTGATNATQARVNLGTDDAANLTKGTVPPGRLAGEDYTVDSLTSVGRVYVGNGASFVESNGNIAFSGTFATSYGVNLGLALDAKLNASSYTAADVLAKIKTVDGAGSGLDSDFLRGFGTSVAANVNTIALRDNSGNLRGSGVISDQGTSIGRFYFGSDLVHYIGFSGTGFEIGPIGPLFVGDYVKANGRLYAGDSFVETNGNIAFTSTMATNYGANLQIALDARIKNDGGTYNINISGTASNATNLGGVSASTYSKFSSLTQIGQTDFPLGQVLVASGGLTNRRSGVNLYSENGNNNFYTIAPGGTALAGTWVHCGQISSTVAQYQRIF